MTTVEEIKRTLERLNLDAHSEIHRLLGEALSIPLAEIYAGALPAS